MKKSQMSLRHLLVLISVLPVLVAAPATASSQEIDVKLKERFLREAPAAWKAYAEFASRLQVKVSNNIKATITNLTVPKQVQFDYKAGEHGARMITTDAIVGCVGGSNRAYSFVLDRSSPEARWVLRYVGFHKDQRKPEEAREGMQREHLLLSCLKVKNLWLPDVVKEPEFKITSIQPHNYGGEDLVRLEFEYLKPPKPNAVHTKEGWMILDPQHDWIIREYEVNKLRYTYYIKEGKNKHPIIERSTHLGVGALKDKLIEELTWETSYEPAIPESEFRLPAFGLPEPVGDFMDLAGGVKHPLTPNPRAPRTEPPKSTAELNLSQPVDDITPARSRGSLWIVAAAAGLLALLFGCRRLSSRLRRGQAS